MEQENLQTPMRNVSKVAAFLLRLLAYLPTLWIVRSLVGSPEFFKSSLMEVTSETLIIVWGLVAVVIPWLIATWLLRSYKKRKNISLFFATLFLLIWLSVVGFLAYGVHAMSQFVQSTHTPPTCRAGYGYTISLGPTDAPIYSKCRPGPNKNNYPQFNY